MDLISIKRLTIVCLAILPLTTLAGTLTLTVNINTSQNIYYVQAEAVSTGKIKISGEQCQANTGFICLKKDTQYVISFIADPAVLSQMEFSSEQNIRGEFANLIVDSRPYTGDSNYCVESGFNGNVCILSNGGSYMATIQQGNPIIWDSTTDIALTMNIYHP